MKWQNKHIVTPVKYLVSKTRVLFLIPIALVIGGCNTMASNTIQNKSQEKIFDINPENSDEEVFKELYASKNVTIEKILSYGQTTPSNEPYIQDHDEWVLIVEGSAKLKLDDKEYSLTKGESLFVPKNVKHWVTYTENPTIWLAVHIKD
ncbi:cupin domain-containing protein [Francisella adeliensis]|nr:cupin domain-containing protein [Francisella adeliensis]